LSGRKEVLYVEVDGLARRYLIYHPEAVVDRDERVPLVVMLDGRGGTPWTAMKSTGWSAKADQEGFVVVYPEATRMDPSGPLHFLSNPQMWNAGPGGSDTDRPQVDDLKFLHRLIGDVALRARIDESRCYMTGFSNGAAMTYRFALAFPGLLAAIAPVAGHCRLRDEILPEPLPMISLFGRMDPLSPYDGGEVNLPWGKRELRPAALDSVHAWAMLCGHHPDDGQIEEQSGMSRLMYGSPGSRDEILFITVDDLGHVWPGGHRLLPESLMGQTSDRVSANDEIWEFFKRHRC